MGNDTTDMFPGIRNLQYVTIMIIKRIVMIVMIVKIMMIIVMTDNNKNMVVMFRC